MRERREQLGMSQEALAYRAGVSVATIQRLEAGKHKPHYGTLLAISAALNTTPAKLLAMINTQEVKP